MLTLNSLLLGLSLLGTPQEEVVARAFTYPGPGGGHAKFFIQVNDERLDPPKLCPKYQWPFEWVVGALGRQTATQDYSARFRVFSQARGSDGELGLRVARMAMRLWDYGFMVLENDHNPRYNRRIVDIYLAFGGQAGGEQLFARDKEGEREFEANVIYIYAVQTFTDPLEMAREIAHEYGHASLPPIGGFGGKDDWGNGDLGERLYLRMMRDQVKAGLLAPADAMGTPLAELDRYVKTYVDPLVRNAALQGPNPTVLRGTGRGALEAYMGLVLWAQTILPPKVFVRSQRLQPSTSAADIPRAIELAVLEQPDVLLNLPKEFLNRPVWVPVGRGNPIGQVDVRTRRGNWAQIVSQQTAVRVVKPGGQ